MYIIVGLGNPEPEYSKTRHNMGFDTVNILAKKNNIDLTRNKYNSIYGTGTIQGEKVIIVKPQTFMNLSGESVKEWFNFYKVKPEELIVIYDDMDVEPGKIKIRKQGGPGSHNGMKSIISEINTNSFTRIRIGLGVPNEADRINYVIGKLDDNEYEKLKPGIDSATLAIEAILKDGTDKAMNKFN